MKLPHDNTHMVGVYEVSLKYVKGQNIREKSFRPLRKVTFNVNLN